MPKKTEYCLAVEIGGNVHRAWLPRKAEAIAFARGLKASGSGSTRVQDVKAVCVVDVNAGRDDVAFEWPKGTAERMF